MTPKQIAEHITSGDTFRIPGCSPEQASAIVERLSAIYTKTGQLSPADVVAEAKRAKSPLHDLFEWNDTVAANEWRKAQAQRLLREIRVERITDDGVECEHVFVNVRRIGDESQTYRPVDEVRKTHDYLADVSEQRLASVRSAVEDVVELRLDERFPGWKGIIDAVNSFGQ